MNILITGGCGYVGTSLIKKLLEQNHKITNIDAMWFGNNLQKNKNLINIREDIRYFKFNKLNKFDTVIHLANIANDPSVELNPQLSWEVNVLAIIKILDFCVQKKIKQFIYASSGSVYGVKKEKKVTEKLSLEPISVYNKTKMAAEKIALSYEKKMRIHIIRPATVCGYSDRLRLDLTINMLTYQAMTGKIKIFGGKQIRPNIHINDLVNLYIFFLKNSKKIPSGYYNAGFENYSINQIVKVIRKKIPCLIQKYKSNDIRSYRLDSSKILSLGFKKKFYVSDAINEIKNLFNKIKKKESILNYNIKTMKMLKL